MKFTVFNKTSGEIQKIIDTPVEMLEFQFNPEIEEAIEGDYDDSVYYISNGLPVAKGSKPTDIHVFDFNTKTWIDPRTLDEIKSMKWESIKKIRDQVENGSFVWNGHVFDCDVVSQSRIQGAAQLTSLALMNQTPFSVAWTLANNTVVVLTAEDMLAVGKAMFEHINSCHQKSRTLRMQIESATTKEEVETVSWN